MSFLNKLARANRSAGEFLLHKVFPKVNQFNEPKMEEPTGYLLGFHFLLNAVYVSILALVIDIALGYFSINSTIVLPFKVKDLGIPDDSTGNPNFSSLLDQSNGTIPASLMNGVVQLMANKVVLARADGVLACVCSQWTAADNVPSIQLQMVTQTTVFPGSTNDTSPFVVITSDNTTVLSNLPTSMTCPTNNVELWSLFCNDNPTEKNCSLPQRAVFDKAMILSDDYCGYYMTLLSSTVDNFITTRISSAGSPMLDETSFAVLVGGFQSSIAQQLRNSLNNNEQLGDFILGYTQPCASNASIACGKSSLDFLSAISDLTTEFSMYVDINGQRVTSPPTSARIEAQPIYGAYVAYCRPSACTTTYFGEPKPAQIAQSVFATIGGAWGTIKFLVSILGKILLYLKPIPEPEKPKTIADGKLDVNQEKQISECDAADEKKPLPIAVVIETLETSTKKAETTSTYATEQKQPDRKTAGAPRISQRMPPTLTAGSFASHRHLEVMSTLVASRGNVNATNEAGDTPLHFAAGNGHLKVTSALITAGANVNAANEDRHTPLLLAAGNGHLEVLKMLIASGSNVEDADEKGNTPLHLASCQGHLEVMNFLIAAGGDVNATNEEGNSALHFAVSQGHADVVNALVATGAEVFVSNNEGVSPFLFCVDNAEAEKASFVGIC